MKRQKTIKRNHEKHVRNTLNGIYDPYPVGNGKYLTYPHIIYNQVKKPFNTFYGYLNIFLFGVSIVSFIPLFIFLTKPEDYIMAGAFFSGLTIFCALALFKAVKHFKKKPTHIEHEGNCIFSGCNGTVAIRRQNFIDSLNKKNLPDTGIGICSFDPTHTFTVPLDYLS